MTHRVRSFESNSRSSGYCRDAGGRGYCRVIILVAADGLVSDIRDLVSTVFSAWLKLEKNVVRLTGPLL